MNEVGQVQLSHVHDEPRGEDEHHNGGEHGHDDAGCRLAEIDNVEYMPGSSKVHVNCDLHSDAVGTRQWDKDEGTYDTK